MFSYQLIYLIYYLYHDDLPAPTSLDAEVHCWRVKWCDGELLEEAKGIDNPRKILGIIDRDFFKHQEADYHCLYLCCNQCRV